MMIRIVHRLIIAFVLLTSGCASLTPQHPQSGFRPDAKDNKHKVASESVSIRIIRRPSPTRPPNEIRPEAVSVAIAAAAAKFVVSEGIRALAATTKAAAALHTATYSTEKVAATTEFYQPGSSDPAWTGIVVERAIVPISSVPPECKEEVPAMRAEFEVEYFPGYFRVRPVRNAIRLLRSRARVMAPGLLAPWTWWTNDRDSKWYAPTKGGKDYLDKLVVRLILDVSCTAGALCTSPFVNLLDRSWTFNRVAFDCEHGCNRSESTPSETSWSRPIPLLPRMGSDATTTPLFILSAEVNEIDAGAARLGDLAELLSENASDIGKAVETQIEDSTSDKKSSDSE